MHDTRFKNRVTRIQSRHSKGLQAEMLAGVGEVNSAKKAAQDGLQRPSLKLAMLGMTCGLAAFALVQDIIGIRTLLGVPLVGQIDILRSDPLVMFASGLLAIFTVMALIALLRGHKSVQMASFVWPAILSAGAAVAYVAT